MSQPPVCLSIAGSDPSGGAGIQADLKTFQALGAYGASAITALTAQNTVGVSGVFGVAPEFVAQQIQVVLDDLPVAAIKTGMLGPAAMTDAICRTLETAATRIPLVVDPVAVARSGDRLLQDEDLRALRDRLIPLATLLTPNRFEAGLLLDEPGPIREVEDLVRIAQRIQTRWGCPTLVKGGSALPEALDVLADREGIAEFRTPEAPYQTTSTHGTGCTLSAALTVHLSRGIPLREAVAQAKSFVAGAIRHAPGIGRGAGPLDHGWMLRP